jgi:hypothetical protein
MRVYSDEIMYIDNKQLRYPKLVDIANGKLEDS